MLTQCPSHFFHIHLPRYHVLATNSVTSTDTRRLTPRYTIRVRSVSKMHVCSSQIALGQYFQYKYHTAVLYFLYIENTLHAYVSMSNFASFMRHHQDNTGLAWRFCIYTWESLHINIDNIGDLVSENRTRNPIFCIFSFYTILSLEQINHVLVLRKKHSKLSIMHKICLKSSR